MTLILTNDDGIDAPGIQTLLNIIEEKVDNKIIVAAPKEQHSQCGHKVTTERPIHVDRRSETEYAIGGTPADCTRIAITQISSEIQWVLSGINAGGNMGVDTYISGTVAAVREAAFYGIPGIAISQYRKGGRPLNWELAKRCAGIVLDELFSHPIEPGTFWNVNLPYLEAGAADPEIVFCKPSTDPLPVKYRLEGEEFYYIGKYEMRDRSPGTDVDICFSGNIAITKIRL